MLRTKERHLAVAVGELSRGIASDTTLALVKSLDRPLKVKPEEKKVLFPTNFSVWQHNKIAINEASGELFSFVSEDEGEDSYLAKLPVDKVQHLLYI